MKPIAAIVEQHFDVDLVAEQIIVAVAEQKQAEASAARHEQAAGAARETARQRRLDIGRWLLKARGAWPRSGPSSSGYGDFLARVGLDDSTAYRYMQEAKAPAKDFAQPSLVSETSSDEEDDDTGPRIRPPTGQGEPPPFRQLSEAELIQALGRLEPAARKRVLKADRANVKGGSGEPDRGMWCTTEKWARAVGPWDLDPFSNPRSVIASVARCMLEDGGDAFDGGKPGAEPGFYRLGSNHGATTGIAGEDTRVWIQPPFELVAAAIAHYGHTRFCALLRWSPDVKAWFPQLWARTAVVCHPFGERMDFDPPPGIEKSGDMPYPHALYYADERDVTDEVRALCLVWRIDHTLDRIAT